MLTNGMYARMLTTIGEQVAVIDCTFTVAERRSPGLSLKLAIDRIREEARIAVSSGRGHIILTDEKQDAEHAAIPMILAAGAVHSWLVSHGLRTFCSITVRVGGVPGYALLRGAGRRGRDVRERLSRAGDAGGPARQGAVRRQAARQGGAELQRRRSRRGCLKILSKMGISVISSYRGGYNFEALGLSRALVADYFPGDDVSHLRDRSCRSRAQDDGAARQGVEHGGGCVAGRRVLPRAGAGRCARAVGRADPPAAACVRHEFVCGVQDVFEGGDGA